MSSISAFSSACPPPGGGAFPVAGQRNNDPRLSSTTQVHHETRAGQPVKIIYRYDTAGRLREIEQQMLPSAQAQGAQQNHFQGFQHNIRLEDFYPPRMHLNPDDHLALFAVGEEEIAPAPAQEMPGPSVFLLPDYSAEDTPFSATMPDETQAAHPALRGYGAPHHWPPQIVFFA